MDSRIARALALSCWLAITALALLSFALQRVNRSTLPLPVDGPELLGETLYWSILIPAAVPAYATVGAIIAARRPRNATGWLCLFLAGVVAAQDVAWQYAARAMELAPGSLPGGSWAAALAGILSVVMFPLPVTLIVLRFPDGQAPGARWRVFERIAIGTAAAGTLAAIAGPTVHAGLHWEGGNPTALPGTEATVAVLQRGAISLSVFALLAAVASIVLRWRRSVGRERLQIKWLAYISAVSAGAFGGASLAEVMTGYSYGTVLIGAIGVAGVTLGIPVAIAIAILRRRLYDIDRLINRTLVYGALTVALALIYGGSVVVLQQAFRAFAGREPSDLVTVASTLAIAALFQPLRRRVQRMIDRRFYRRTYDAAQTLQAFGATLRNDVHLHTLTTELITVVDKTMQPTDAWLWLRRSEDFAGHDR